MIKKMVSMFRYFLIMDAVHLGGNMNRKGFSLVELMVVVAIIGILATIAVPNFQRFQARAKQSNARVELSGIYTAQKAFHVEYSTYHSNLPAVGFVPDGVDDLSGQIKTTVRNRYYASRAGTWSSGGASPVVLNTLGFTTEPGYQGYFAASTDSCSQAVSGFPAHGRSVGDGSTAATTFVAVAAGCPANRGQSAIQMDVWSIDQDKILTNVYSGITN